MFIGHFAVGLAAKKAMPKTSLGVHFLACQFLDLLWPIFAMMNLENVRINHSLGTYNGLDLLHIPYSHSLVMTLLWSVLIGGIIGFKNKSLRDGLIIGAVVSSHWILDWVTHIPDMPLAFGETKLGLGLWKSTWGTLAIEGGFFAFCLWTYIKAAPGFDKKRLAIFGSLIGLMLVIYFGTLFGPKPPESASVGQITGPAFALWLTVFWAHWGDKRVNQ